MHALPSPRGFEAHSRASTVQVGVHGAGLINSFFMRPGSAMVEIFPCRFPADWASHYFWRPALVERRIMPFQVHMQDEARCQPSQLEKSPAGLLLTLPALGLHIKVQGCLAPLRSDSSIT